MADAELNITTEIEDAVKEIADFAKKANKVLDSVIDTTEELQKETKKVANPIKRLASTFKKSFSAIRRSVKKVTDSIFSIKGAIAGVVGAIGIGALVRGISNVTEAAAIQEQAVKDLNTALKISGEFSEEASQEMQDYAAEIEKTTEFGDELVLSQLALAKSFGATNEQAKLVTDAAIELAAAQGKSLEEATRQVSKTLGGFAGELGELSPAIKELTAEQLKNGDAARILLDAYAGTAAARVQTFGGSIAQLQNSFGTLREEIGKIITENPVVVGAIGILRDIFDDLASAATDNKDVLADFVGNAIKGIARVAPTAIKAIGLLVTSFKGILQVADLVTGSIALIGKSILEFKTARQVVNFVADGFKIFANTIIKSIDGLLQLVELVGDLTGLEVDVKGFRDSLDDLSTSLEESVGEDVAEPLRQSLAKLADEAGENLEKTNEAFEGIEKGIEVAIDSTERLADEIGKIPNDKKVNVEVDQDVNLNAKGDGKGFFESLTKDLRDGLSNLAKTAIGAVVGGAEGAKTLLVEGAALAIDQFAPGVGQAAKPLIDALTKGPDFVKKQVEEFVKALPALLKNIAEALPVLIETLADNTDEIIIALVEGMPDVAAALAVEVPLALADPALWERVAIALRDRIAENLSFKLTELDQNFINFRNQVNGAAVEFRNSFNTFAVEFKNSFADAGKEFAGSLRSGLSDFATIISSGITSSFNTAGTALVTGLKTAVSEAISQIRSQLGIGGGDKGGAAGFFQDPVGATQEFFSRPKVNLQEGAVIPSGFPNDSFVAGLTTGEEVVNVDDRSEILQGQQQTNELLGQAIALLAQPQTATAVAEVEGEALANIILSLNRQNQRLAG